jgi:hypothetical protein
MTILNGFANTSFNPAEVRIESLDLQFASPIRVPIIDAEGPRKPVGASFSNTTDAILLEIDHRHIATLLVQMSSSQLQL